MGEWGVTAAIISVTALYALLRGLSDLRERRFAWAVLGLASAVGLLCMPITTHAVKVDLPIR